MHIRANDRDLRLALNESTLVEAVRMFGYRDQQEPFIVELPCAIDEGLGIQTNCVVVVQTFWLLLVSQDCVNRTNDTRHVMP